MLDIATYIALLILIALSFFQLALAFGAPLGKYAWGGGSRVLPVRLRIASAVSILSYLLFAAFLVSKAGVIVLITNQQLLNTIMWISTTYFFIGIGMNAISRSSAERGLMTPVAGVLAISFLIATLD